jgi:hypothetical protein
MALEGFAVTSFLSFRLLVIQGSVQRTDANLGHRATLYPFRIGLEDVLLELDKISH